MFRTVDHTRYPAVIIAMTAATLSAACADQKGGKSSVMDVIPSAEASVVPVPVPAVTSSPKTEPVVPGEVTYAAAESAYTGRKYVEAKAMFEELVIRNPANGWNYYMLGLSAWKSGDRESAESAFRSALERDPKHVKSHINLARVMSEDGRAKDALVHAEKVVQLDSVSTEGYKLLGKLHGDLKNTELALLAYNKAIVLNNRDAWSMNNLAFILLENGRHEEALGPLALATTIEPRNATLLNNLGLVLELSGRFTQATSAYKTAMTFESGYEKATAALARIAGRVDDPSLVPLDLKAVADGYAERIKGM